MNEKGEYQHQQSSLLSKFNHDLNLDYDEVESPSPLNPTRQSTLAYKLQGYRNDLKGDKKPEKPAYQLDTINENAFDISTRDLKLVKNNSQLSTDSPGRTKTQSFREFIFNQEQ